MEQSSQRLDLRQLRIRAKELLRQAKSGNREAIGRILPYFRSAETVTLTNAQMVIARENGFESWSKLRRSLEDEPSDREDPTAELFRLLKAREEDQALDLIRRRPALVGAWQKDEWGWVSPLHMAARLGLQRVAEALVEAGAEIYAVNQGGYPPVFEAARVHDDVAEYLMQASAARDHGQPPTYGCGIDIVLAARLGMLGRVKMHVDRDPLAVYRRGCIGESVLHWPAHNGYVEVVTYLLDHGALIDADEIGLYGGKPLHWASEHAPNCVRLLLERGADPKSRNLLPNEFEGFTPLHMMASQRDECIECAQLLIDAGADPRARDLRGRTPEDVAREGNRHKSVEFLRKFGP